MVDRYMWLDALYPQGQFSAVHGDGNPATDSLRALLLMVLFALTFFACLGATILRGNWANGHITSYISCVGGGVFLATCLLDLLPEGLESFEKAGIEMEFPIAEAAIVGGLLMVLTVEQLVIIAQENGWLGNHMHLHDHGDEEMSIIQEAHSHEPEEETMLGSVLLVFALSLHALFEGLSLAVITDASKLLEVFAALIIHKTVIGFSLGARLVENGMRTPWVALCALCFSIQVLIGGLGGMSIMALISGGKRSTAGFVACILQGIACGTFLYITTFEVLPHEIKKPGKRFAKLVFIYLGVFIVISFMLVFGDM